MTDDVDDAGEGAASDPIKKRIGRPPKALKEAISDVMPADKSLITEDELHDIEADAEKEAWAELKEENKEKARTTALKKARGKVRRAARNESAHLDEDVTFNIDLPGHADRIVLDGTIFMHGRTYTRPRRVFDSLREVVFRAWQHEREIGYANGREYDRRPMVSHQTQMSMRTGEIRHV